MSTLDSQQANAKIRRKLKSWHQHPDEPQTRNSIWGFIKFHNQFNELNDGSVQVSQKIRKISIDKNITYRNLLSCTRRLLNAPKELLYGYTLFLRQHTCFKSDDMFVGEFLDSKNVGQLKNSFLIDLMPSPVYYTKRLVSKYNENQEDAESSKEIFGILNHSTLMFHLKSEFGFPSLVIFLLTWLPRAGDSWPWHKWDFRLLFQWTNDNEWDEVEEASHESHELILTNTCNNINTGSNGLFDACLELLNWFFKKCPKLTSKFLKIIDTAFISEQLVKASLSNYCQLLSLFISVYENSDEETQQDIEKSMDDLKFFTFFATITQENNERHSLMLEKKLYQIQQIRFNEIRQFLHTSVNFENASDLANLIEERYPEQRIDNIVDLISLSPPGYYLFEAIYSAINGAIDTQLLSLLDDKHMSMHDFIRMLTNVLISVFESISSKENPFEPKYHAILVYETNSIAWIYKNACVLFKDIWLCDRMHKLESNLRFYKTSQLVSEILQKTIETKPTTLNDWTERLQQSFMVKWMCSGADFSFEEDMENDWKMKIQETLLIPIKEIVSNKYIGYLHQGFVFKKYVKNPSGNQIETCERRWLLDRSQIAFRVYECNSSNKQKLKTDDTEDEANAPELVLGIKSITRIIQGEEYADKSKVLFPSKRRLFRKDKNPHIPNGVFIETANEEHEILYEDADEFQKFITALNIVRFDRYPQDEVDKLLECETKMRLLNLKYADVLMDQEMIPIQSLPQLPTII